MFCGNCGAENPDGARFCANCGNPLMATTYSTGPVGQPASPPDPTVPQGQAYYQDPGTDTYDPNAGTYDYDQGYEAPSGRIRTDRDLVVYILLSIVTCGIYSYWYVYQLAQDVNTMCAGDGEETPGLLPYILLSIVTCGIYSYYWEYQLGNRIAANAPRYGVAVSESGTDILLWRLLGTLICFVGTYIGSYLLIKNANMLAEGYNHTYGY